jgi:hypothetical protein
MEFKIETVKARVHAITWCINFYHLNIKIIEVKEIPGPGPRDRMDTEITFKLLSDDLGEIFKLGFYTALEKLVITM